MKLAGKDPFSGTGIEYHNSKKKVFWTFFAEKTFDYLNEYGVAKEVRDVAVFQSLGLGGRIQERIHPFNAVLPIIYRASPAQWARQPAEGGSRRRTALDGSFSAVSAPIFASK